MADPLMDACAAYDLNDAAVVTDLFEDAAEAYRDDPHRTGGVIDLPIPTPADADETAMHTPASLLVSGDLHDHRVNFRRLAHVAKLGDPASGVGLILQELIHGPSRINGADLSGRILAQAAALKLAHPTRVWQLLSNHELSQVTDADITKGGLSTSQSFNDGLEYLYGDEADTVADAIRAYVLALPLAVRVGRGTEAAVMCAHSLPAPRKMAKFDPAVLEAELDPMAVKRGGWAYEIVWGRNHDDATCDALAEAWGVQAFLLGHQPAEFG
ncbi:MAG: hypothetical protein AAF078_11035, partial [Planctomycetota bacterium]